MIRSVCNSPNVTWRGPLTALTHTECGDCGATNCQQAEAYEPEEEPTPIHELKDEPTMPKKTEQPTPGGINSLTIDKNSPNKLPGLDKSAAEWIQFHSISRAASTTAEALQLSDHERLQLVIVALAERLCSAQSKGDWVGDFVDKPIELHRSPGIKVQQCPGCRKILRQEWETQSDERDEKSKKD